MGNAAKFSQSEYQLWDILGDVRDKKDFSSFRGIDCVVHAAALKQVPAAEYNPMELKPILMELIIS